VPYLLQHAQSILLLTTIVRPTYSVYSLAPSQRGLSERTVSSSLTTRIPRLIATTDIAARVEIEGSIQTNDERSDEALICRVSAGDLDALASLFQRYARIVRGVAYRVLKDTSEADDLLQDIFLLVHRLCETFDSSKGSARFWILQMTYRRAISRRRYLTSRHFYTHLDLDQAENQLGGGARSDRPRIG